MIDKSVGDDKTDKTEK